MNSKIEEKLLLLRAKNFADNLKGIESFSISLLDKDIFLWHREQLNIANAIDIENKSFSFEQPVEESDLISAIITLLNVENNFFCWLIYEDSCKIFFRGIDFHLFLVSIFRLNKTYDLSLIFESPDRVITVSDNEYDVDILYKLK